MDFRVFKGQDTRQVDGHTCKAAEPESWYYEPRDYPGDVLYSPAFPTWEEAVAAGEAEFCTAESLRLDSRIDYELARLGWSCDTAPEGSSTLDAWNTETEGVIALFDEQETTLCYGEPLLETLRTLKPGVSWNDLWDAIIPHVVES